MFLCLFPFSLLLVYFPVILGPPEWKLVNPSWQAATLLTWWLAWTCLSIPFRLAWSTRTDFFYSSLLCLSQFPLTSASWLAKSLSWHWTTPLGISGATPINSQGNYIPILMTMVYGCSKQGRRHEVEWTECIGKRWECKFRAETVRARLGANCSNSYGVSPLSSK